MDKELVIHIGLRKAGSSTVQQFLNVNTQQLKSLGCDYPRVGRRSRWSHLNIAADVRNLEQYDADYGGVIELRDHVNTHQDPYTIISSEVFESAPRKSIQRLHEVLSPAFTDTRILLVVRDPQGLIPSSYAEGVVSGRKTVDFDALFERLIVMRRLKYFLTARRWALVWGWKAIRVRLLDRQHMINGDLVDDFMSTVGLDIRHPDYQALKRPGSANVSPGWRVIEALRALYGGKHGLPDGHPLVKSNRCLDEIRLIRSSAELLGGMMGWNAERGSYITRAQAKLCQEVFAQTIDELNGRLTEKVPAPTDLAENGVREREFLPDAKLIAAEELRSFYDELGGMIAASSEQASASKPGASGLDG